MCNHTFFCVHITKADIRPDVKGAVCLVIVDGHLIFFRGMCGYVWVNMSQMAKWLEQASQ